MIPIRQGKTKNILDSSRESALSAVETYNRPSGNSKLDSFIVMMIIAWTKLFHAYFLSIIGYRYFYKESNGRYKIVEGERKAWQLGDCIKKYKRLESEYYIPISDAVVANIDFFIHLRNKIEHRYWKGSEFDILLFGECQALLYNYENMIIGLFGEDYSLNTCLAFALQFSHMRAKEQLLSQKYLMSCDMRDIKKYIEKYRTDLSQEIYDSQEFSVKLLQIPKVSNTTRADLAVEFVNWNSLDEEDRRNYEKLTAIIKDKVVMQSVSNANLLKPSDVLEQLNKIGISIKMNQHTALWRAFNVRPSSHSDSKFETIDSYCIYDEPHNDYLYTSKWVEFIADLFNKHGFTSENLLDKCKEDLHLEDFNY